jgi:hypothetical protein
MPNIFVPSIIKEPAHEMMPHLEDILRELYRHIRERYQPAIDQTFDQVAKEIGFVVSTTMPMNIEIGEGGVVKSLMVSKHSAMKGTMMDRTLAKALKPLIGAKVPVKQAGAYEFFIIWPEALKYKLSFDWCEPAHHTDWLEPAHPTPGLHLDEVKRAVSSKMKMVWESHEPAHWLDPKVKLSDAEAMHVSLLDEVYPELRLLERIKQVRNR